MLLCCGEKKRIAVFVSGKGSNFSALLLRQKLGLLKGKIVLCVSDNPHAFALDIAKKNKIETNVLSDPSNADEIISLLDKHNIFLVVLAGYIKMIPSKVVEHYKRRIVNIHPALLPSFGGKGFYGIRVHEAVIKAGVKETGVTVHFVDEIYDHGPVIIQSKIKVKPKDTPQTLQKRVLKVEHSIYWKAINKVLSEKGC